MFSGGVFKVDSSFYNKAGTEGPYTSASNKPVLYPNLSKETAKFIATVDFPTPPLQEETAIICFTFSN